MDFASSLWGFILIARPRESTGCNSDLRLFRANEPPNRLNPSPGVRYEPLDRPY